MIAIGLIVFLFLFLLAAWAIGELVLPSIELIQEGDTGEILLSIVGLITGGTILTIEIIIIIFIIK